MKIICYLFLIIFNGVELALAEESKGSADTSVLQTRIAEEERWTNKNHYRLPRDSKDQDEMIRILEEWAQIAPLPKEKKNFRIITGGSAFTRAFRAYFTLSKSEMDKWIANSPGLKDVKPTEEDGWICYLPQGGKAGYAKVMIDPRIGFIVVYTYWS